MSYPTQSVIQKKLGQLYNIDGNPILNNLRQTHYQDESGTQWRMSFFMASKSVVKIYRLYQAQFVDESMKIRNITTEKIDRIVHHVTKTIIESLKKEQFLNEGYNLEKFGKWNVVEGSKMLGTQKGLEKWGWLSDLRLYA